jgi:hypothetical protein
MQQISSKLTFFHKRVFPFVWFGMLTLFLLIGLLDPRNRGRSELPVFMIVPVAMAVVGYFVMKKLVFDLVDAAFDDGDAVVVRDGGQEARIALSDIINVSYSAYTNPSRVTLMLRKPSVLGERITFAAPVRFVPFTTSPVIDELIARIDAERRKQASRA